MPRAVSDNPVMDAQERLDRAEATGHERAVFAGDSDALAAGDRELDAVEAALALARGRSRTRPLWSRAEDPDETRPCSSRPSTCTPASLTGEARASAVLAGDLPPGRAREDQGTAAPLLTGRGPRPRGG